MMLNDTHQTPYAAGSNLLVGILPKNANPSKHRIIAIFARVFSFLLCRKWGQVGTSIALFSTVLVTNSPTNAQCACVPHFDLEAIAVTDDLKRPQPVAFAAVMLQDDTGRLLSFSITNHFGVATFPNLRSDRVYVITLSHHRYTFTDNPRAFLHSDGIRREIFLAAEFDGKGVRRDIFEILAE